MHKESWKVFLACAFGAGIGSLIALQVNHWFWWVGLLAGGLAGYLSYEWKAVVKAIPQAFRAATSWRPCKERLAYTLWMSIVTWNICFFSFGFLLLIMLTDTSDPIQNPGYLFLGCLSTSFLFMPVWYTVARSEDDKRLILGNNIFRRVALHTFPLVVLFWHFPYGLFWLARRIPWFVKETALFTFEVVVAILRFLKRFGWQLFIRIHSEARLICGVDAMIGAAIGYFAHHAVIGALAGGVIGLVNYAVVTQLWLRPRGYIKARS